MFSVISLTLIGGVLPLCDTKLDFRGLGASQRISLFWCKTHTKGQRARSHMRPEEDERREVPENSQQKEAEETSRQNRSVGEMRVGQRGDPTTEVR